MDGISHAIGSVTKYIKQAWSENTASAVALVFIPCLLVAASRFPAEAIASSTGAGPCYWLLVDALIVCFTISALAAVIDICLDIGYFANQVPNDSVPLIVGGDMSYPHPDDHGNYPGLVVSRIVFALIIRCIGSCFALLTLSTATVFTLVPLQQNTTLDSASVPPYPPQCSELSSGAYNYKLFFGFGTIAAVFILLRLGLVVQSHPHVYDDVHLVAERGAVVPAAVTVKVTQDDREHEMEEKGGAADDEDSSEEKEHKRRKAHRSGHRSRKHRSHRKRREEGSEASEHEEEKRGGEESS